ncbi:PH domain-containing protein [Aliikangiella sp. IMCC44653]
MNTPIESSASTPYSNEQVNAKSMPSVKTLELTLLSSQYALINSVTTLLFGLFFLIVARVSDHFIHHYSVPSWLYLPVGGLIFVIATMEYFRAKASGYALREKDIAFKTGLFWHKHLFLSHQRIQHIDITQGPIERHFGFANMAFYTAGGASADLKIPGLNYQTAQALRAKIMQEINHAAN